jgi:hypothetical protein
MITKNHVHKIAAAARSCAAAARESSDGRPGSAVLREPRPSGKPPGIIGHALKYQWVCRRESERMAEAAVRRHAGVPAEIAAWVPPA